MKPFDKAIDLLADLEGGWSDDPEDKGGKTRFGISQASYPEIDLATLTPERAKELYHEDFWLPIRGDALEPQLAQILFIFAVNSSARRHPITAGRIFQRTLNLLGADLNIDGRIGSKTLEAAAKIVSRWPEALKMALVGEIYNYYHSIVLRQPSQAKFLKGWLARLWKSREI